METALLCAGRLRAARWAAILVAALLTFLLPAQGDPPAKPDPKQDVEAANKLAERYDGGVESPVAGSPRCCSTAAAPVYWSRSPSLPSPAKRRSRLGTAA
jgi:hypothetical protein